MLQDSIETIKGCGIKTKEKLNNMNIFTCEDLINYKGPLIGIPVTQLKKEIKKSIQKIDNNINEEHIETCKHVSGIENNICEKRIINHTWQGIILHIIRSKSIVTRVKVGDIVIKPFSIELDVFWTKNKQSYRRTVSPLSLLHTHSMWSYNDIISENSDDESHEPTSKKLPKFLIHEDNNDFSNFHKTELTALHNIVKEVNRLYMCIA